jgi:hypothetical protein
MNFEMFKVLTDLAETLGAFYNRLIKSGVPAPVAQEMTMAVLNSALGGIK